MHESVVALVPVTHAEVVVRRQLDALGHIRDRRRLRSLRHAWWGREFGGVMVLESLEALKTFQADVLDFLRGGVNLCGEFGANAAHDVCAFCVGGGG